MNSGSQLVFSSLPKGIFIRVANHSLFQKSVATDKINTNWIIHQLNFAHSH